MAWQQPYVNLFKKYGVGEWKKCSKEGDVIKVMDRSVKCSVYKLNGQIPSGNYIKIPHPKSPPLGLTGHNFYLLFKPVEGKYFLIHLHVCTSEGLVVRISLSNMFKEFKSTFTSIQFPVTIDALPGDEKGSLKTFTRWTLLYLDLHYILSVYLNKHFMCVKALQICSTMFVKNAFTSNIRYEPGIRKGEKAGLLSETVVALPMDMSFPLEKHEDWHAKYDFIQFPAKTKINDCKERLCKTPPGELIARKDPREVSSRLDEVSCELPAVNVIDQSPKSNEIYETSNIYESNVDMKERCVMVKKHSKKVVDDSLSTNKPLTLLKLKNVLGFNGDLCKHVVWSTDAMNIIYACQQLVVIYHVTTGKQEFLLGHTDKISCLERSSQGSVLATAQIGTNSVIRIWKLKSKRCVAVFHPQCYNVTFLSFSSDHGKLCVIGDSSGKQVISVWDTSLLRKNGLVLLTGKAITELKSCHINGIKFSPYDDTRMVSCGKQNIRVWRIKPNSLRSCPVDLNHSVNVEFTAFVFKKQAYQAEDTGSKIMYFASKDGDIYTVDYKILQILKVHKLMTHSESVGLTSIACGDTFVAVGSTDGLLRLWSLDFKSMFLEAEYDDSILVTEISFDNGKVVSGTKMGSVGILDIGRNTYTTVTRSHKESIISFSFEPLHDNIVTISGDSSIKIWDRKSLKEIYEFNDFEEKPSALCCHPTKTVFVCGFENGVVMLFNLSTRSLMFQLRDQLSTVKCLLYSPDGINLYSAAEDGTLLMYRNLNTTYDVLHRLAVAPTKGPVLGNYIMAIDINGNLFAAIGPTEHLITVFKAKTLEKLLNINISSMTSHYHTYFVDEAVGICFSPPSIGHLLVLTSTSRLLKFDCSSGQLLSEFSGLTQNEGRLTSFTCSMDGRYIVVAADSSIKVCDYHFKNEQDIQVFVGHSGCIKKVQFTQDNELISSGNTLFVWNVKKSHLSGDICSNHIDKSAVPATPNTTLLLPYPENYVQIPVSPKPVKNLSVEINDIRATFNEDIYDGNRNQNNSYCHNKAADENIKYGKPIVSQHAPPNVVTHFKARPRKSQLAKKQYVAPPHKAGMKISSVIGCHGNGRKNVTWQPESGLFAYTSGCMLVKEDLSNGSQHILMKHTEEISTIAVQHDGQIIATGGSLNKSTNYGIICIWHVQSGFCHKVLEFHQCSVTALAYSRDDRFLISIGDYRECSVVIWRSQKYIRLSQTFTSYPIHGVEWNPYASNEFVTVGRKMSVSFWQIEDIDIEKLLVRVEAGSNGFYEDIDDVTAVTYASANLLFTASSQGEIYAWDIRHRSCIMHWQADDGEIGFMSCNGSRLITGSTLKNLCVWTFPSLFDENSDTESVGKKQVSLLKNHKLDAAIVGGVFDDALDMGVVPTANGTIWFINWETEDHIKIINGYHEKITQISVCDGDSRYCAVTSMDGSLRLLNVESKEQIAQFLVLGQGCCCVSFYCVSKRQDDVRIENENGCHLSSSHEQPSKCFGGYQDGTLRVFDFARMAMILKMKPHTSAVTALTSSNDGRRIISGSATGLVIISNSLTGMTVRVINDHRGTIISGIKRQYSFNNPSSSLWLVSSNDCRISLWRAEWCKDACELLDWITFSSYKSLQKKGEKEPNDLFPPTLASFNPNDEDMIIYTGGGLSKEICLYSIQKRKVMKTISMTDYAWSLDVSPRENLLVIGCQERLVKLVDFLSGTFQDFTAHSDSVQNVRFTSNGKKLFTSADTELFLWEILM